MSGHQEFTGPIVELTSSWSRDDSLATGRPNPPRLRVGRERVSGHIMIQVDDSHQFTMPDDVAKQLGKWLEVL